jgi:transposase
MQSNVDPRARRVHDAQLKSKVLAECSQPGTSVSAVALAHGLNANLVHKWRRGIGLQRTGLKAGLPARTALATTPRATHVKPAQFVPIGMPMASESTKAMVPTGQAAESPQPAEGAVLQVELRCGANQVTVRWPATQAAQCTQWLHELTMAVLGAEVRAP